jgi:UDP-N-acetylglucosamine 2-epimerase (non-hydrolysing)
LILISFGTRPEWIKIKPVLEQIEGKIPYRLLFTGQHVDLLSKVSEEVDLFKLKIEQGNNRLDSIVSSVMNQEFIFEGITSVLVQGDTTSAFSIALAAFHRKIKVIHLEAGLRTYDKNQPFPEEFNRQAISRIADVHLCPTETSKKFLESETTQGRIDVVGNTVLDNLVKLKPKYTNKIVVTMHRRENHYNMGEWFAEINKIAQNNKQLEFLMPLHPNPNVQKYKNLLTNVKVIEPMDYKNFMNLLADTRLVITDSGGLQEETSFLLKKCIVCREKTERLEGIGSFAFLCSQPQSLNELFEKVNNDYKVSGVCPYGDGYASKRIYRILKDEV